MEEVIRLSKYGLQWFKDRMRLKLERTKTSLWSSYPNKRTAEYSSANKTEISTFIRWDVFIIICDCKKFIIIYNIVKLLILPWLLCMYELVIISLCVCLAMIVWVCIVLCYYLPKSFNFCLKVNMRDWQKWIKQNNRYNDEMSCH